LRVVGSGKDSLENLIHQTAASLKLEEREIGDHSDTPKENDRVSEERIIPLTYEGASPKALQRGFNR
jgi:hypothetical protein